MKYLLDSNVSIQAKDREYGLDFCPGFWDWMVLQNHRGVLASIQHVADELYGRTDDLATWAKERRSRFFLKPNAAVGQALREVGDRVSAGDYEDRAIDSFLKKADCWLIAHAVVIGCAVVSHEVRAHSKKKIKIPSVCDAFDVRYINPYQMLREDGAKFVLSSDHEVLSVGIERSSQRSNVTRLQYYEG